MNRIEDIKYKHAHGYYNPRGQDDVQFLLDELDVIEAYIAGCGGRIAEGWEKVKSSRNKGAP